MFRHCGVKRLKLLFLFLRFLPMISIAEMRAILPEAKIEEVP